jgi:uncharacterized membrane protein
MNRRFSTFSAVALLLAASGCGFANYPAGTDVADAPSDPTGTTTNPPSQNPTTAATYSQVGPILRNKCAGCHASGSMNFTSYSGFARNTGIVTPGNPEQSRLYTITQSGTMPPSGSDLTDSQLSLLYSWIEAGALNN